MKVKKYQAASYRDALALVKNDMGPDAVILTTREVRRSRFLGLGRGPAVEIVAAKGLRLRADMPRQRAPARAAPAPSQSTLVVDREPDAPRPTAADGWQRERLDRLEDHLRDMRSALEAVASQQGRPARPPAPDVPPRVLPFYEQLVRSDVRPDLAAEVVTGAAETTEATNPEELVSAVRDAVAHRVFTQGPIQVTPGQRRLVGLIGPTGVGKTTTIAKLAADFTFFRPCRVGLLSIDTYRVAAVEQLRTFAKIMTVPVQVAATPEDVPEALARFSSPDLVLVDTAGRSQRNVEQVEALRRLLDVVEFDEIHLVLSATTKSTDLADVVERFGGLGANRLLFTKLDETTSYGSLFNTVCDAGLPLSYVTTGQMVPEDFEVADPHALADLLMGRRLNDA